MNYNHSQFEETREVSRADRDKIAPVATQRLNLVYRAAGLVMQIGPQTAAEYEQAHPVYATANPAMASYLQAESAPVNPISRHEVSQSVEQVVPYSAVGTAAVQEVEQTSTGAELMVDDPRAVHLASAQRDVADAFDNDNFHLAA
jgi:hypothetical protein